MAKLPLLPRYSLRSLLIFVTVVAVCTWSFWHGWPLWQTFQFESSSKKLRVGMSYSDVRKVLERGGVRSIAMRGPDAFTVRIQMFQVSSQLYGIALFYPKAPTPKLFGRPLYLIKPKNGINDDSPSVAIKVFRFDALANNRIAADQDEWHKRFRELYKQIESIKLGEFVVVHSEPKEALQIQ